MDDFGGVFEVLAADENETRLASRKALALSEARIDQRLGGFLRASASPVEFDARFSYVEDDFKGIVSATCEETGGNAEAIANTLRAHYRPAEQHRTASVHTARKPKMCPYHKEVVDISLSSGDPRAGYETMSSHAWGDHHCQGGWDGSCNFKRDMVTQSYWDDHQKALDERREQRKDELSMEPLDATPLAEEEVAEPVLDETPADDNVIEFPSPDGMVDGGGSPVSESPAEPMAMAASAGGHFLADSYNPSDQDDNAGKKVPCPQCGGNGKTANDGECPRCHGQGKVSDWGPSTLDAVGSKVAMGETPMGQMDTPTYNQAWGEIENSQDPIVHAHKSGAHMQAPDPNCPVCNLKAKNQPNRGPYQDFEEELGRRLMPGMASVVSAEEGNAGLGGPSPKMDKRKWTPENVKKLDVPSERHPTKEKDPIEPIKAVNDDELKEIGEKTTERVDLPEAGINLDDSGFASGGESKGPHTKTFPKGDQANPVTKGNPITSKVAMDPGYDSHPWGPEDRMDSEYEEPVENPQCPMCGGPGLHLGDLGKRSHFRCRNCGIDFSSADQSGHEPWPEGGGQGWDERHQGKTDDVEKNPLREMIAQDDFVPNTTLARVAASLAS